MMTDLEAARVSGREGGLFLPQSLCPYELNTAERREWQAGFQEGRRLRMAADRRIGDLRPIPQEIEIS